jgi:hypothetical protein
MAIGADYVAQRVRRAADIGPAQSFCVAVQTVFENRFRLKLGEGDNGGLTAASLDVGLTRTVAAFAACSFRRLLAGSNAPVVGIFIKVEPDVGMAGPANVAAYKGGGRCGLSAQPEREEENENEYSRKTPHLLHYIGN